MPKLHDDWTLLPHGPLTELEPGLLTVVGQIPMPLGNFPRRMTVAALDGGGSAIFSPIALSDKLMERVEALGAPRFLVVPNGAHRLDLRPFHRRYPEAQVVTARGAVKLVSEAVKAQTAPASLAKNVDLIPLAGTNEGELTMIVRHAGGGITLLTNDIIGHVAHPHGIGARIMARLMGFGPRARITRVAKRFFVKDKPALAAQFRAWAEIEGLKRLIPSHGDIIARPAELLARLANELDG